MDQDPANKSSINFKYIFADDYNPVFVTGAYGGVIPSGEIVANFFLERHGLPILERRSLESDQSLGDLLEVDPPDQKASMVRFVGPGIVLSLATAKRIHYWLGNKIEEAQRLADRTAGAESGRLSSQE